MVAGLTAAHCTANVALPSTLPWRIKAGSRTAIVALSRLFAKFASRAAWQRSHRRVARFRVQLQTQRVRHLEDGGKARVAFAGKCFVQALSP